MRNIIEYPATLPEIVESLRSLQRDLIEKMKQEMSCGDMQPYLVGKAAELIDQLGNMINHAPTHIPVLPENPTQYDLEDHGAALTEYAYAQMVNKVLILGERIDMEMPTDK